MLIVEGMRYLADVVQRLDFGSQPAMYAKNRLADKSGEGESREDFIKFPIELTRLDLHRPPPQSPTLC